MIRTSWMLPDSLHQRLLIVSRSEGKTVSEVGRELLDKALARREVQRNKQVYTVLKELDGKGEHGVTDASSTIDDLLFGNNGAWRGSGK